MIDPVFILDFITASITRKTIYLRPPVTNDLLTNILSSPQARSFYPSLSFIATKLFIAMERRRGNNTSISLLDKFSIEIGTIQK